MHRDERSGARRRFLKAGALAAGTGLTQAAPADAAVRARPRGSRSVMDLAVAPLERVRVAFIGVGQRGAFLLRTLAGIDGVEVKAVCDIHAPHLQKALAAVVAAGHPEPASYGRDEHDWKRMLERRDIDAVFVCTPWDLHVPMARGAMQAGMHAFVEVPAALTVAECWDLVDTAERTQRHCMMLENVCYGREELLVFNMVRAGLFGELLHGEAAYIHELRWQIRQLTAGTGSWRTFWEANRNGNLYPTHGLGPLAWYMDINRGDRFDYLNSQSSPALGRRLYAQREFPADHPRNRIDYRCGDINTSLIKTVKGRTILVQHDTTTPRPYTRHNLIQGTNGVFAGFPDRIALETLDGKPHLKDGKAAFHEWDMLDPGEPGKRPASMWYERFDHPLWKMLEAEALRNGGHGGMDFIMLWRIVWCLRHGRPLDQSVYDAAAWSVVTPLSIASVADRGNARDFPDFTRGAWKTTPPLELAL